MIVTGMGCKSGSIQWLSQSCLGHPMATPDMPTTIPSPADRSEYHFFAIDKDGRKWRWDDWETLWVVETTDDTKRELQ